MVCNRIKFFEIWIDNVEGKVTGKIVKRSRGFLEWIRFQGKGLSMLLEGVEAC